MAYTKEQHIKKVNTFEDIAIEMRELYEKKNWDYQDSFGQSFQKWGLPVSCIRLGDKLNRLESFAKCHNPEDMLIQGQGEGLEDDLIDLANYAIMTLIEIRTSKKNMTGGNNNG